jgi:hypothetical protein
VLVVPKKSILVSADFFLLYEVRHSFHINAETVSRYFAVLLHFNLMNREHSSMLLCENIADYIPLL